MCHSRVDGNPSLYFYDTIKFMKKAVIFDMDGLMFNTEKVYTYAHEQMFLKRGLAYNPEINCLAAS